MPQITLISGLVLAKALTRENHCSTYDGNPGTCKLRIENCPTLRGVAKSEIKTCVKSGLSIPFNPICCPKTAGQCEAPPIPKRGNSLRKCLNFLSIIKIYTFIQIAINCFSKENMLTN